MIGSNEQETATLDSIVESWVDLNTKFAEFAFAKPEAKEAAKENFVSNVWPPFVKIHEALLAKNGGNGHYLGNSVTHPDLVLVYMLERLEDAAPGVLSEGSAPQLVKALSTIKSDPKLKSYVESPERVPIAVKK